LQIAQQIEKNKRTFDELSEVQKEVIIRSKKVEVPEDSDSDAGIIDSEVNSEDIGEKANSESDPVDKPLNSMYNGF
jgi:hypothetical protein